MPNLIEVSLDEGTRIYLEIASDNIENDSLLEPVASEGRVIKKAKSFLDGTINQIKAFSNSIASSIKEIEAAPDEFEVEFAVKFAADAGIIISSVSSEANITIKMKWSKEKG